MNSEIFGGVEIFRPSLLAEAQVRLELEAKLREVYPSKTYYGENAVNAILKQQFKVYEHLIHETLGRAASPDLITFALGMYDNSTRIEQLRKEGKLTPGELGRWLKVGPSFRRATKHLVEKCVELLDVGPDDLADEATRLKCVDYAFVCAEQMIDLSSLSDHTLYLYPDTTELTVHPAGCWTMLEIRVPGINPSDYLRRLELDRQNRSKFFPQPEFTQDVEQISSLLEPEFSSHFGFSFGDACQLLSSLITNIQVPENEIFDVPFFERRHVVECVAEQASIDPNRIEELIAGFTVSASNMKKEGRRVEKPKQQHRAYRRGFFEVVHLQKPHLIESRTMASESLAMLIEGFVFRKSPSDWTESSVKRGLDRISLKAGRWFADTVTKNMNRMGIAGKAAETVVGEKRARLRVPQDIGGLDFLGYIPAENLLVVLEYKMLQGGYEARYYKDDVDDFVTKKKSFLEKMDKKTAWLKDNMSGVIDALRASNIVGQDQKPVALVTAFVTYRPAFSAFFLNQVPCVSLTELAMKYMETGKWPYRTGVHVL